MQWGDGTPRITTNPSRVVIDLIDGLGWGITVGAAIDPADNNTTLPAKLPFAGVATDGRRGGPIVAEWLVRIQLWGDNPTPLETLSQRLEAVLTQGGVTLPDGVLSIDRSLWYSPTADPTTGLLVASFTVAVKCRYDKNI